MRRFTYAYNNTLLAFVLVQVLFITGVINTHAHRHRAYVRLWYRPIADSYVVFRFRCHCIYSFHSQFFLSRSFCWLFHSFYTQRSRCLSTTYTQVFALQQIAHEV